MATKQRKSENVGGTQGNRPHAGAKNTAKKEGKKIRRRRVEISQLGQNIRGLKRPPRLVKAISESTSQFKTGRYES